MPHFFIDKNSIAESIITISDKENYNHIARSLHAKVGEKLLLIDNEGIQYDTKIENITSSKIITRIKTSYTSNRMPDINVYLAQVVLKKEAQANVIQKACELGVKGIYPLISDNCIIKKSYISEKIEKYNKLSYEASKQCERADIATVYDVSELKSMLENDNFEHKIACVEKYATCSLKKHLKTVNIAPQDKILVIIGCEGGFSEAEFSMFKEHNIPMVSLGNLILRADTAVISAISNIMYELSYEK